MPQIYQIFHFSINLATLNQPRERDGFHHRQNSVHPSPINSSPTAVTPTNLRNFFKFRQIRREVLQTEQTGVRLHNAVEIDGDPRFSEESPPMKRRTRIGIGKREL
jgi:hypothetical protein